MTDLTRQLPPLGTLVVFEAAVRHRSFSRAADECALSQASVSRQMRQLEENLGVRLFDRQRYDVMPTSDGKTLYDSVRRSLSDLASTAKALRANARGLQFHYLLRSVNCYRNPVAAHRPLSATVSRR